MSAIQEIGSSRPSRLAHVCLKRLELTIPVNLKAITQACRVPVLNQPAGGPRVDAMLTFYPKTDKWAIFVDGMCNDIRRRRFSIAHELGHFVLHRNLIKQGISVDAPEYEDEANEFAGQLLVPTRELRLAQEMLISNLDLYFGVTQAAINWRLRDLGYRAW